MAVFITGGQAAERVNYVKYIKSTGTQFIDTEIKPSGNALRVVMKFRYTAAYSSLSLFGNHNTAPYSVTPYGSRPQFYVGTSSTGINCGPQTTQNADYILDVTVSGGKITAIWNGVEYTATYSGSLYTDLSIFLFGSNKDGVLAEAGSGYRLEYFQIYDNNVLVRDLWPCYDPDAVVCMYCKLEKRYFYNQGSGEFIAGPTITGGSDISVVIEGSGIESGTAWAKVTIDSIEYTEAAELTMKTGQEIECWVKSERSGYLAQIYVNDTRMDFAQGGEVTYSHIAETDCTITLSTWVDELLGTGTRTGEIRITA